MACLIDLDLKISWRIRIQLRQHNLFCTSPVQIHQNSSQNMSSVSTCFMISCQFQYLSFCIPYQLLFVSKLLEECTGLCFKHKKKCSTQSGPNIATQIIFYNDKLMLPFTAQVITSLTGIVPIIFGSDRIPRKWENVL